MSPAAMHLPGEAARLFPHHPPDALVAGEPFVIARLLEDGDRHDLAWLFERTGEDRVATWLAERAGRQLSRRSRAFWALVLATAPSPPAKAHDDLWLL